MKINFKFLLALTIVFLLTFSPGCGLIPLPTLTNTQTATSTYPLTTTWVPPSTSSGGANLPDFVAVVEKVKPSVVIIKTDIAAGSGWIVDASGIIVTNNHVIKDASSINVILDDGSQHTSTLVKADPVSDLAVISIDARNLPAATIGNSAKLKVGQPVAAIGNALDLGISMTGGWVSRLNASITIDNQTQYGLIGTDAAINPGNSGGPLVNMAGEVVGITSAKLIETGVEGIGYAISIDSAMPIIQQLITKGYIVRPFLGVQGLLTVDASVAAYYQLGVNKGVLIRGVLSGGPAAKAGLQAQDVIVAIDDTQVDTYDALIQVLYSTKQPGQKIKVTYYRGGSQTSTTLTLGETSPPS